MPFNGSGTWSNAGATFSAPVTGTTISSTAANTFFNDLASNGLSFAITKNGQTTVTANIPMAGFKFTGLGAGSSNGESVRYEQITGLMTNPITTRGDLVRGGVGGTPERIALGSAFQGLISNGTDAVWADSPQSIMTTTGDIVYASASNSMARLGIGASGTVLKSNGTIPSWGTASGITLGTEQATTSGTAIDFTGIPAGTKRITVNFVGVSTNGSSAIIVQLGDSGGVETSGYLGAGSYVGGGGSGSSNYTDGFGFSNIGSGNALHGSVTLTLEDAANFHWCATGALADSNSAFISFTAGAKATSAELDRVRITMSNGTDAFDAGAINITYES